MWVGFVLFFPFFDGGAADGPNTFHMLSRYSTIELYPSAQ